MNLIAVDWGTSSLRAARLDSGGQVQEERSAPRGILTVPPGEFATVLGALCAGWMSAGGTFLLISGMAGSKQGWIEAPYCACPAGPADLAAKVIELAPGGMPRIALVPGLADEHGGVPDVMRGEEVQVFGAIGLSGMADGLFVLPGTHNKWVRVQGGRILGFHTHMTGEFYALLSQHLILARTLDTAAELDEAAFVRGVHRAGQPGGLLHHAFGARTLALFERTDAAALASYLSGLLIGEELRHALQPAVERRVVLIGSPALTRRYALALRAHGVECRTLGAEATWAGLFALSRAIAP